jgi:glycine cleavage system transcriptional repressor
MAELVICAVGPDRPGLVDELTGYLFEHGGNIADSRMVNLRGQFALVLLVEVPAEREQTLRASVADVGAKLGLTATASPRGAAPAAVTEGIRYQLKVSAMDQPGIVHRVTHLLHSLGANVEDLQTRLEAGPHSGTPLFSLSLTMTAPAALRVKRLRAELEVLCENLNCDYELQPGY